MKDIESERQNIKKILATARLNLKLAVNGIHKRSADSLDNLERGGDHGISLGLLMSECSEVKYQMEQVEHAEDQLALLERLAKMLVLQ